MIEVLQTCLNCLSALMSIDTMDEIKREVAARNRVSIAFRL